MRQNRDAAQRNLYVLNLPLNVSTEQFEELFKQHGQVAHAVILATLDGLARRRGFILMQNSREADVAIKQLDGHSWHGYRMEVSFAIVQRNGAPLPQVSTDSGVDSRRQFLPNAEEVSCSRTRLGQNRTDRFCVPLSTASQPSAPLKARL